MWKGPCGNCKMKGFEDLSLKMCIVTSKMLVYLLYYKLIKDLRWITLIYFASALAEHRMIWS